MPAEIISAGDAAPELYTLYSGWAFRFKTRDRLEQATSARRAFVTRQLHIADLFNWLMLFT